MGTASHIANTLDIEMLLAGGGTIHPSTMSDHDLPERPGAEVAEELGGRYLLRYMRAAQVGTLTGGSTLPQWVTPTPYSSDEAVSWLMLPDPLVPRTHLLFLQPARIDVIRGPRWVHLGGGIEYFLPYGFCRLQSGRPRGRLWLGHLDVGNDAATELLNGLSFQIEDAFAQESMADWTLVTHGAERHGSWEWAACKQDCPLDRYISIALTPADAPGDLDEDPPWVVEIWGGADDGRRYTRVLVRRANVPRSLSVATALSWLEPAKQRVSALGYADLTELYPAERAEP